jgi:hypothetical protein
MRTLIIIGCVAIAAALASCTQNITAPISQEPVSNIMSYFWWNGETPMPFLDSIPMTACKSFGTLSFANNASGLLEVSDGTLPQMQCIVNEDSIVAYGFTLDSVMGQNNGSYFSSLDTEMLDTLLPLVSIITDNNPTEIVVGTDSGVYFYQLGYNTSFQTAGKNLGNVTALTENTTTHTLYAGTSSGTIFSTTLPLSSGSSWTSYPYRLIGPVGQLLWLQDNSLAATVTNANGIDTSNGGAWTQILYLSNKRVTMLGKIQESSTLYLLAGTTDGTIGAHSLNPLITDATPVPVGIGIYCFGSSNSVAVAGTDDGVYEWSGPSQNTWNQPSNITFKGVTSLDLDGDNLIVLSNGSIETTTLSGGSPQTFPTPKYTPQQVGWISSTPWVLTSRDFDTVKTASNTYQILSGFSRGYWPQDTGGLVLMRDNLFANDSSWRAGTIVTNDTASFPITARVLAHLDTLYIEASGIKNTYPDVLEVRYAFEHPGELPESNIVPYWIMYYAKNQGPVMFDKESSTGLERHEIKP